MSLLLYKSVVLVFALLVASAITGLSVKDALIDYRKHKYNSATVFAVIALIGLLTAVASILTTLKVWSMI